MKISAPLFFILNLLFLFSFLSCHQNNVKGDEKFTVADQAVNEGTSPSGITDNQQTDNFIIDSTETINGEAVYMLCSEMPQFPGGEEAFSKYINTATGYPSESVTNKEEGRVIVKFVVAADGHVCNVKIERRITERLDNECLRVFKSMPDWKAGRQNGKPVAVSIAVPVRFALERSEIMNGIYITPGK